MNTLLVDIGNSAIKIARGKAGSLRIRDVCRVPYIKSHLVRSLEKTLKKVCAEVEFEIAGVSLLNKKLQAKVGNLIQSITGAQTEFISPESDLPYQVLYAPTIGADRLCSAAAGTKLSHNSTVLVIDFGTATTYTVVRDLKLLGGMISPGIGTSLNALAANTELPMTDLRFPRHIISKDTAMNINGGVLFQSLFAMERYIMECKAQLGELCVIATGGFSKLIMKKTSMIDIREPDLVLMGINVIIAR